MKVSHSISMDDLKKIVGFSEKYALSEGEKLCLHSNVALRGEFLFFSFMDRGGVVCNEQGVSIYQLIHSRHGYEQAVRRFVNEIIFQLLKYIRVSKKLGDKK